MQPFLEQQDGLGQATRSRMLSILQDPSKKMYLKVEMAAIVDVGKQFIQATYKLEGNEPLVLYCYEYIEAFAHAIQACHFPDTDAVIREPGGQPAHFASQLYAESCVQPGFDYFFSRFHGELGSTLAAFKAARLFLPHKVCELQVDATSVDSLTAFPFLQNKTLLSGMKSELPTSLASASGVAADVDPASWWKHHSVDLSHRAHAVRLASLILPSSAEAKRVFSLLTC